MESAQVGKTGVEMVGSESRLKRYEYGSQILDIRNMQTQK
jgi:hypothetical protein